MPEQLHGRRNLKPGRRMACRLVKAEAYRRIMAGGLPRTLSEFVAQLSAWLAVAHPRAPVIPTTAIEEAIHETWDHRHEMIGTDL